MISGILLAILIGFFWSLVGIYYKLVGKWNLNIFDQGIIGLCFSIPLTLIFFMKTPELCSGAIPLPGPSYWLYMIGAALLNSLGGVLLQKSMYYGKSGVTWAIAQSALIVPFVGITLIFGEPWNLIKVGGTVAVVLGMAALSFKPSSPDEKIPRPMLGLLLAIVAFFVIGLAQGMTSASSFLDYDDKGNFRAFLTVIGGIFVSFGGKLATRDFKINVTLRGVLLVAWLSSQTAMVYFLQFIVMDKLASVGMNGIFYPLACGTCIAGYSIYSVTIFKEKINAFVLIGTALIIGGIFTYCFAIL